MSQSKRLSRRDVLRLAAVTATGALLAACAPQATAVIQDSVNEPAVEEPATLAAVAPTEEPTAVEAPVPTAVPTEAPPPTEPADTPVAQTADVPPGSSLDFTFDGKPAILVNLDGEYHAFINVCTHNGCQTRYYGGPSLSCPCHGSAFSPATGEVIQGPAERALRTIQLNIEGDSIYAVA